MKQQKEIVEVEKQVSPLESAVKKIEIKSPDDFTVAVELGGHIKSAQKFVTGKKELITKPLNEALKNARDMFRPFETALDDMESMLKKKMLTFKAEEDKKRELIENRVEKGTMKVETAKAKVEDMTDKTVHSASGAKATETFTTEYVVVDVSKIPSEFMIPDMAKIKQSFKEGVAVNGVEVRKVPNMRW